MKPVDDGLDERLRRLARPHARSAERIAAAALLAPQQPRPVVPRFAAVAAGLVLGLVALGLWQLPAGRHPTGRLTAPSAGSVVLVRSADGTVATIYGGVADKQDPAPGTGFVISEGVLR